VNGMPFFIDDFFLRMLGISLPPFDMIWILETICDYAEGLWREETSQRINNRIKENRLLYELGEMTKEEYERRNGELSRQRGMNNRINNMNLHQRISLLG